MEKYPEVLVKNLLWTRRYHKRMAAEIEAWLKAISAEHGINIPLED